MGKYVGFGPARQIEQRPGRNELETGLCEVFAILAGKALVQRTVKVTASGAQQR